MRVLIGPINPETMTHLLEFPPRPNDEYRGYQGNSWPEIQAALPAGWKPDVVLHYSLEYHAIPAGLETEEAFTVAVIGDWNLGMQACHQMAGMFDLLVTDEGGARHLRAQGVHNVLSIPIFSADPNQRWYRPDVPRDLDIVMVGNMNFGIQRDREHWVARVARLSRQHRVCVTNGVFGEDYAHLLNRAKIVFNRSIRGEINMRVYEAALSGALLFYERDNLEIGRLFTDREHCVLYGDDDLESLLDYYLAHEAERERIATAGRLQAEQNGRTQRTRTLLDTIEQARTTGVPTPRRAFQHLSPLQKWERRIYHSLLVTDTKHLFSSAQELAQLPLQEITPTTRRLEAGVLASIGFVQHDSTARIQTLRLALERLDLLLKNEPEYAVGWFNLAQIQIGLHNNEAAWRALERTRLLLHSTQLQAAALQGPYLPRVLADVQGSLFVSELEAVWAEHAPGTLEWTEAMQQLLLWRVEEQRSQLALDRRDFLTAEAAANAASALRPDFGWPQVLRARALAGQGRLEAANAAYKTALTRIPLRPDIWLERANVLRTLHRFAECRAFLTECATLLSGCPFLTSWRQPLQEFASTIPATDPVQHSVRLLAHPDWNTPDSWQPLIQDFVTHCHPEQPANLLLPVPEQELTRIVGALEQYVEHTLQTSFETLPDITLIPIETGADVALTVETDSVLVLTSENIMAQEAQGRRIPRVDLPAVLA